MSNVFKKTQNKTWHKIFIKQPDE